VDHLCLVEAVNGFREGVVIRISDAADRGFDACFDQALGVSNAHVLRSPVRMIDEAAFADGLPRMQGLLESIEHEVSPRIARDAPTDDPAGEGVDDEGDISETLPGRHVCEINVPQLVRRRCPELAMDLVVWAGRGLVGTVVFTALPRTTPFSPSCLIRRATVQRATLVSSRSICRQMSMAA
jgi:hypothetical protein